LGALPAPLAGREALILAAEIASFEPDEARAIFEREHQKLKPLDANNRYAAYTRAAVAGVAARLNLPEANALADETLAALIKQYGENDIYGSLEGAIEALATGGAAFTERALGQIPVARRTWAADRAVLVLAQFDLDGARRLLDLMPGWAQTQAGQNDQMTAMRQTSAFARGALAVIPRLARTDPAAALALARRVTGESLKGQALSAAALGQPRAEAEKLLREVFDMPDGYMFSDSHVSIARRASVLDPALGETMALDVEKRIQGLENRFDNVIVPPELAWVLARTQPGRARLLLEREWENAKGKDDAESWRRQGIVLAMARADWERALELTKSLNTPTQEGQNARSDRPLLLLMTQWALAPSELRAVASLGTAQSSSMAFSGDNF
jgi:hypothetical protein